MAKPSVVTFEKARTIVLDAVPRMGTVQIDLLDAMGYVIATDITADADMPSRDLAAMDGYACRAEDREFPLKVIETIPAGALPRSPVTPGACSRIMTGAPTPSGANTVVMFEDTEYDNVSNTMRIIHKRDKRNIRHRAEDMRRGAVVLRTATVVGAPHIAVLAAVGKARVSVFKKPRVGIIATGNELVAPSCGPGEGQIRDSNSHQLYAQVKAAGGDPVYHGIVNDDAGALHAAIEHGIRENDVLLLSGGVSKGDFDFVPGILEENGCDLLFDKIAVKPGRPTVFGAKNAKRVFGLPGNPVSTFVIFEMLVRPLLFAMTGGAADPRQTIRCMLSGSIVRKNSGRQEFRPVQLKPDGTASLVEYHGSAHIHAYICADGIVSIPAGITEISSGTSMEVYLLR